MNINEEEIIKEIDKHFIFQRIKCVRTNSVGINRNVYEIGLNQQTIFGEIDFSKKRIIYRIKYYLNGFDYHIIKYIENEKDLKKCIDFIMKYCINGEKQRQIDIMKEEIRKEFEE